MELSLQTVLVNVTDLDRSLRFYREVLGLALVSRRDQAAALMVSESGRRQVLVLRQIGDRAQHPGGGALGVRLLSLETGSPEDLDVIEARLAERGALLGRRDTDDWRAVFGVDPDRVKIAVSAGRHGASITAADWERLDDAVYSTGQ